jgi:hypothetical protein
MSEDTQVLTEPTESPDDVTLVHDPVAADKKAEEKAVEDITQILNRTTAGDEAKAEPDEEPPEAEEPKDEEPAEEVSLNEELQSRAEEAGIDKDLAEATHQAGVLEKLLTAFDRTMVERFQSEKTEKADKTPARKRQETEPPQEEDVPELDPEYHNEDLLKRDAHHKRRIDELASLVDELIQERDLAFTRKFDSALDEIDRTDLSRAERAQVSEVYETMCRIFNKDVGDLDLGMIRRAANTLRTNNDLDPKVEAEIRKDERKRTITDMRKRDDGGRFLPSTKPAAPPKRRLTEAESDQKTVGTIAEILDR